MKAGLKTWAAAAAAGILVLVGLWLAAPPDGVLILTYHDVRAAADNSGPETDEDKSYVMPPDDFEAQIRYLIAAGYSPIALSEAVDGLTGKKPLPPRPVVITFDDGYAGNYTEALPILERYGIRATVFLIAGQVGEPGYLSWGEVEDMFRRGIEIGSHTMHHLPLPGLSPGELQEEISASKALIEKNTTVPVVTLFAYPFGAYSPAAFSALREAGYQAACTGRAGINRPGGNVYALRRVVIPRPRFGLWEFRLRLLRAGVVSHLGW